MSKLVTDDMVEAALDYLAKASQEGASARANRLRAEFKRKRLRSKLILEAPPTCTSATLREAWAEAHPDYLLACEDEVKWTEQDELHRGERNRADVIIEAWRTENANNRAGGNFR